MKKSKASKIKALHFPYYVLNPYLQQMTDGLKKQDIEVQFGISSLIGLLRVSLSGTANILHLHWVSGFMVKGNVLAGITNFCIFQLSLVLWKARKKKIVWTVHNLANHENKRLWLDSLNTRIIAKRADAVLVHGHEAISTLRDAFQVREEKIFVVHHGNYQGDINLPPYRKQKKNGVKFLFFGVIRPYKGLPELIHAFSRLAGNHSLHIAGLPKNDELKILIEKAICDNPSITGSLKFLSNQELEKALGWCDVVVLPFKDIFTSGSVLMALTAGRPVVAPRIGLIPEYLDNNCAFLYNPEDSAELFKALKMATESRSLEKMSAKALMKSKEYSWNDICRRIAEIYLSIL